MRLRRFETTAIVRRLRGALLWASLCSIAAGLCLLALPLAAAATLPTATRPWSNEIAASLAAFALAGLLLAITFNAIRDGILTRAALWLDHALGAATLERGIETLAAPNDLEEDRAHVAALVAGCRAFAALLDLLSALPALLFIAMAAPLMAPLSWLAVALAALLCAAAAYRLHDLESLAARQQTNALAVWRTAASSTVALAARGLVPSTVAAWRTAHGKAIAVAFEASTKRAGWVLAMRAALAVSSLAVLAALGWAWQSATMAPAAVLAAALAHVLAIWPLDALARRLAPLVTAWCAFEHLAHTPSSQTVNVSSGPATTSPACPGRADPRAAKAYAEAS